MDNNKKITWSSISKIVGWDYRHVKYPSMQEIDWLCEKSADKNISAMVELLRYFRFLPVARSDHQREIIGRIIDAIFDYRKKLCE